MRIVRKQLELSVRRQGFASPRVTPAVTVQGGLIGLAAAFYNKNVEKVELGETVVTEYDNGMQSHTYNPLVTVTKCMDDPEDRYADGREPWWYSRA